MILIKVTKLPPHFLLTTTDLKKAWKKQHDFLPFNFHQHYRQRYHHRSFFGHLVLPETKQTKCPLCIFEPALVNNKCLAGSQSSNMAAKSKLARPNLPPGAKIRCKSVAPSPHFCTKTIGGSARPEYFGWKQLRTIINSGRRADGVECWRVNTLFSCSSFKDRSRKTLKPPHRISIESSMGSELRINCDWTGKAEVWNHDVRRQTTIKTISRDFLKK